MAHVSEGELIEAIRTLLGGTAPGVSLGPGDDAAVVEAGAGELVLTTDMLVESVDFELRQISARDLGSRAIAVNVSDIAAMAASPRYALVSLGLPADIELSWVVELFGGMRAAGDEYALSIVGGDLSRASEVVISVTVAGSCAPGRALTRAGAIVGHRVVVTGTLGRAAGGLMISQAASGLAAKAASSPWGRALLEAFARPVARVGEAQTLAGHGASAMIDVSDGLASDLDRLCRASGRGARVSMPDIPVAPELDQLAELIPSDPLRLATTGGEDFELIATLPPADVQPAAAELKERFGIALTDIGEISEGDGVLALAEDGTETALLPEGWDHFAR